jgi:hypothetical protein
VNACRVTEREKTFNDRLRLCDHQCRWNLAAAIAVNSSMVIAPAVLDTRPVPRPPKELKGFAKVNLQRGESKQVTLPLNRRAFSFFDVKTHNWKVDPGDFAILVGSSSADIQLMGTFNLSSE